MLVVELLVDAPLLAASLINQLSSPGLLLAIHGLRIAVVWAVLWALLEPLRRWRAAKEPDEGVLLDADVGIELLFPRFMVVYIAALVLAFGGVLVLRVLGVPAADPLAPHEYAMGVLYVIVGIGFNAAVVFARLRGFMDAYIAELGPALAQLSLERSRTPRSVRRELIVIGTGLACATMLSASASSFANEAKQLRAETRAALQEQLVRASIQLREEGAITDPGVQVVSSEELPASLVPDGSVGQLLSTYDSPRDLVICAQWHDGQRWLMAEARLPDRLVAGVSTLIGFSLFVLALVAATFSWLGRAMVAPLTRLDAASRELATKGELGALARVHPARNDEIGSLVRNFNDMLDMLEELVDVAKTVSEGDLAVEIHHPGELHDAFRIMLEQLRQMVERLRSVALEVTSASTEIHTRMQAQAEAATEHAEAVEHSSLTIVGLADAARQISAKSSQVLDQAEANLETVDSVVDKIAGLDAEAARIAELLDQIREIAARSDLLALNGSLEATRAGEAGRGFALVAAEMRRLAERVTLTVADVRARVSDIEVASVAANRATDTSRALAEAAAQAAREIASLTRAQTEDTRDVSTTTADMAEFVRESSAGMTQISATAQGLLAHLDELEQLTASFELEAD